jgi:CheY-like chemotaxis protein
MFLDLRLPGMDGRALCSEIRKNETDATIIAITGHADQFELMDCIEVGFDGYFLKPINLEVLYKVVEEAFDK